MPTVHRVEKCCRPDCNTYAVDLDGRTPCDECRAHGVAAPPAPLRPVPVYTRPVQPQPPPWEAFRGVRAQDLERAARSGAAFGRELADVVTKLRRAFR